MKKIIRPCDFYDLAVLLLNEWLSWFGSPGKKKNFARALANMTYAVRRSTLRRLAGHLNRTSFCELTSAEVKEVTRQILRHRWEERLSYATISKGSTARSFRIEGLENLQDALSRGKGVILWDTPVGKKLLAKAALIEKGFALCQVHGPQHGGSLSWVGQTLIRRMHRRLEAKCLDIIDIQDESMAYLRHLVQRLKQNGIICIAGFGNLGQKFVQVEFMGGRKRFATGQVNLARTTGASIIPMFCYQDEDSREVLVLEKPVNLEDGEDWNQTIVKVMADYARLMESYARRHPDQWHWFSSYW